MREQFQDAASYAGLSMFCGSCALLNTAQAITIDSTALAGISAAAAFISSIVGFLAAKNAVRNFADGLERTLEQNTYNTDGISPR